MTYLCHTLSDVTECCHNNLQSSSSYDTYNNNTWLKWHLEVCDFNTCRHKNVLALIIIFRVLQPPARQEASPLDSCERLAQAPGLLASLAVAWAPSHVENLPKPMSSSLVKVLTRKTHTIDIN